MKRRTRVLLIILAVLIVGFAAIRIVFSRIEANLAALKNMTIQSVDLGGMDDGSYTGSYSSFPVSATVRVTVRDHVMTGIEIIKHTHGQGAEAEAIPEMVIAAQSLQVDSIAGATYSSKVILKAIENALLSPGRNAGE